MSAEAAEIAAYLANPEYAVAPCDYSWETSVTGRPGLYSWWVDDEGRRTLESSLGEVLAPLIYAGQAGAASARAKKPSTATLYSRIHGNHLNGTAYGSTFRKTLCALLLEPLQLTVEKSDRLRASDRKRVSEWMCAHLKLTLFAFDGRDQLGEVESEVLAILDPPLNLQGMPPTSIRRKLSSLRKSVSRPQQSPSQAPSRHQPSGGRMRFMVPTGGPKGWRALLADPDLHWVTGRSARTLAHCWEDAEGWPTEIAQMLAGESDLDGFLPVYGFPELKTPLPGGRRETQTDLLVIAESEKATMTMAVEGKVDETFGPIVKDWLQDAPTPGKRQRLSYLATLLKVDVGSLGVIRYQLVHRTAAAKIEANRIGSEVAAMVVHSWGREHEGFNDYASFARLLGVNTEVGRIGYSEIADVWLGWAAGDTKYLSA